MMTPKISKFTSVALMLWFTVAAVTMGACSEDEQSGWADQKAFETAMAQYEAGLYTQSRDGFDTFMTTYPDSAYVSEATYYHALSYYHLEEYSQAAVLFEVISSQVPAGEFAGAARYYQGRCAYKLNGFDTAIEIFSAYLQTSQDSSLTDDARYFLGRSYYENDALSEALTVFDQIIALGVSPYLDSALFWAGRTEYDLGTVDLANVDAPHITSAQGYFNRVLQEFAGGGYDDNASYFLAMTWFRLGEYQTAIDAFSTFTGTFPLSVYADNADFYAAYAHYIMGEHSIAAAAMADFVQMYPDSGYTDNAIYMEGRAYYRVANGESSGTATFEDAIARFEQIIVEYPASNYVDNAYYYEIRAHIKNGDCNSARNVMTQFESQVMQSDYLQPAKDTLASNC